jgi:antitoxin (DNA-binding transcriptional repressor) of toxin-antitoxin stability system
MKWISVEQAKGHLGDVVDAAAGGEEIVLVHGDQAAVRLVPVGATGSRPRFGSAKGLIQMSDDFDAPLDDFREYAE